MVAKGRSNLGVAKKQVDSIHMSAKYIASALMIIGLSE